MGRKGAGLGEEQKPLPGMGPLWAVAGAAIRLLGKSAPGRMSLKGSGRTFGKLVVRTGLFGMSRFGETPTAREIASRWINIIEKVGGEYEVGTVEENSVEIRMLSCPAGLTCAKSCDAGMEADRTIVRELGGELDIIETIAQGAPKCRMRVLTR